MGRCHNQILYKVVFSCCQSGDPFSASSLSLIGICRNPLQVSQMGQSNDNLFFLDQIFLVNLLSVRHDFGSSGVLVFFLDFQKLVADYAHHLVVIGQQFLVVGDFFL